MPESLTHDITATDAHPFWVQDPTPRQGPNLPPGHWIDAADLHPGDLLRTPNGTLLPITTLTTWTQPDTVHNLTIDTTHTYYALAGSVSILVHNDGYYPPPEKLPGFPKATLAKRRTPVQGGGGMRKRWEDGKRIYEWDSQHGEVEVYDKKGRHLGAYNPNTGEPIPGKGAIPGRRCGR